MPAANKKEASSEVVSLDEVKRALLDRSVKLTVVSEDPEIVQRRMIEATLSAETIEEVWGNSTVLHAEDIVGRPFTLTETEFRNSDYDEGLPIFAVMHAAFGDTGEMAIVTSGAAGIVTRLIKLVEFGALPIDVRVRSSKTNSGYTVLDLEPVPDF